MADSWEPEDFRDQIVIPAIVALDAYSKEAERILMATAMTESNLRVVYQKGGPALGYFQMEPATHNDIFANYLGVTSRQHLLDGLHKISDRVGYADELAKNAQYAAAMARIFYLRVPAPLPPENNLDAIWEYYKKHWNTYKGAATRLHFMVSTEGVMAL